MPSGLTKVQLRALYPAAPEVKPVPAAKPAVEVKPAAPEVKPAAAEVKPAPAVKPAAEVKKAERRRSSKHSDPTGVYSDS